MALTFFWTCEGNDFSADNAYDSPYTGANYSPGDDIAGLINSAAISSSAARVGISGLRKPASVSGGAVFNPTDIFPGTLAAPSDSIGSAAFSTRYSTAVYSTTGVNAGIRFQGALTNDHFGVFQQTSGNLALRFRRDGGSTLEVPLTGGELSAGAWFGVVIRWSLPDNLRRIELYDASGVLIDEADSSADFSAAYPSSILNTSSGLILGGGGSGNVNAHDFDNFFIADAYDEPLQNNFEISRYSDYTAATGTVLVPNPAGMSV